MIYLATTKYSSKCGICREMIVKGTESLWDGQHNIFHPACLELKDTGHVEWNEGQSVFVIHAGMDATFLPFKIRSMPMAEWNNSAHQGTVYAHAGLGQDILSLFMDFGLELSTEASAAAFKLCRTDDNDRMSKYRKAALVEEKRIKSADDWIMPFKPSGDAEKDRKALEKRSQWVKMVEDYKGEQNKKKGKRNTVYDEFASPVGNDARAPDDDFNYDAMPF